MKKILFLDDQEERHAIFHNQHLGGDVRIDHVRTAPEAIAKLHTRKYDEVHLDHDLGTEGPKENCGSGYDVAEFITCMAEEERPLQVVIHSFNMPAAERMFYLLRPYVPTKRYLFKA